MKVTFLAILFILRPCCLHQPSPVVLVTESDCHENYIVPEPEVIVVFAVYTDSVLAVVQLSKSVLLGKAEGVGFVKYFNLVALKTVDCVPVESIIRDIGKNVPAEHVVEEIPQGPTLNHKKESDLESSEYHHPLLLIKYPVYGGYHGYHGHHGYYRPYWHHWHGGHGWGPYYGKHWASHGGYHGGGPGYGSPWIY